MKRIALAAVVGVVAAVALTSCVRLVEEGFDDQHAVGERITEVRLQNGSGDVLLRSREGATGTDVRRRVHYPKGADKPTGVSHRVEGSTLVLDGCGSRCSVDYEVTVPSEDVRVTGQNSSGDVRVEKVAAVEIEVGSGNTSVRDVAGVVRVDSGSGDLDVIGVGGDFTGRVGSGNATLTAMGGAVIIESSSGDVEVRTAAAVPVRAEVGSGNLTVRVPGGPYRLNAEADSGEKVVEVPTDPNAQVQLVLRTGSGDLSVHAA